MLFNIYFYSHSNLNSIGIYLFWKSVVAYINLNEDTDFLCVYYTIVNDSHKCISKKMICL